MDQVLYSVILAVCIQTKITAITATRYSVFHLSITTRYLEIIGGLDLS